MEYFVYIPNMNKEYLCMSLTVHFLSGMDIDNVAIPITLFDFDVFIECVEWEFSVPRIILRTVRVH